MGEPTWLSAELETALEGMQDVALVLDAAGRVAFVNRAWEVHAAQAEVPQLSRDALLGSVYDAPVVGPLRAAVAERVWRAQKESAASALHGECNTPTVFRLLTTTFDPIRDHARVAGVLVRHSLRAVGPLRRQHEATALPLATFMDGRGAVVQCSCCRRVRAVATGQWHLSLSLLVRPHALTSHELCDACLAAYFAAS